jgi:predicted NBD/HSP70 family sugar kinase
VADEESANDVGAFLAVFAALLLDNVLRLDETVGRVTDFVMASKPDRETIVTLQSFDRLKQEFEALGDALTRYAEAINAAPMSGAERSQLEQHVISGITVADLKDRLLSRLQEDLPDFIAPTISPEEAAEVGVDVVY